MSHKWILSVLASLALACPAFTQERVAAERSMPRAKVFVTYDLILGQPLVDFWRPEGAPLTIDIDLSVCIGYSSLWQRAFQAMQNAAQVTGDDESEAPRQPGSRQTSTTPEDAPGHRLMLEATQPLELVPFQAENEI